MSGSTNEFEATKTSELTPASAPPTPEVSSEVSPEVSPDLSFASNGLSEGRRFWRSTDELEQSPEFLERLHKEFPQSTSQWVEDDEQSGVGGLSRRNFLTIMGAGLAAMGLTGCSTRKPDEKIVPYVIQPEEVVPGKPLYYATAFVIHGAAHGVIVESHEGRPTKVEGNPAHPASLGASNIWMQASILQLYDPDRSQSVRNQKSNAVTTWDRYISEIAPKLDAAQKRDAGARIRVLAEPIVSPTLAAQVTALKKRFPALKWHTYSPCATAAPASIVYDFARADVIVSLDSDFLSDDAASLAYARQFSDARRVRKDAMKMSRVYVAECTRTITGAMADHRIATTPDGIESIASALAGGSNERLTESQRKWVAAASEDLKRAAGRGLVVAGRYQPSVVHALADAINAKFGATANKAVVAETLPKTEDHDLADLVHDMNAGGVDLLFILGGNPVYNAPADLEFAAALDRVSTRVHLSQYHDETSFLCQWHLPQTHELEQWGDANAFDGTTAIQQPLIAPLYEGRSVYDVVSILLGDSSRTSHEIVREYWMKQRGNLAAPTAAFELWWDTSLKNGVIADSAGKQVAAPHRSSNPTTRPPSTQPAPDSNALHLVLRPDPSIGDGQWSNNAWLQELPKPITKITWDNAAILSPATAARLAVENDRLVTIRAADRSLEKVSVRIVPGQPDNVVTLHLGYGRTRAGALGTGRGVNAYALRTTASPWHIANVEIVPTEGTHRLAVTQEHQLLYGRDIVRVNEFDALRREVEEHPDAEPTSSAAPIRRTSLSLYKPWDYSKGNQWGMVIDQTACIGCNACVIACQSENNIPTVGPENVIKNREMHWIRIDTYFSSDPAAADHVMHDRADENPETYFQPMACQHCENAPCEVVCPVGATVHDVEGTNNMVYNRCVGTRYCSNNCPYKVRRFNYLEYGDYVDPLSAKVPNEVTALGKNPNVSVRRRGVMEKCSYCIQRVNAARIEAKKKDRPEGFVEEGEVQSACQQSCPTQAIIFGNLNDPKAHVRKLKDEPTNYGILTELNTEPRTTYLARVRNSNPAMKKVEPLMHTDERK